MVVGASATVISMAVLVGLVRGLGLSPQAANVPSLVSGSVVQFLGNRKFVFSAIGGPVFRQSIFFALAEVGALLLNTFGFQLAMAHLNIHYTIVRLGVTIVVWLGFSFPLWHVVFRPKPTALLTQP